MNIHASRVLLCRRFRPGAACVAALVPFFLPLSVNAAPLILEPVQAIHVPDSFFTSIRDVAIDGDFLIMGARRTDPEEQGFGYHVTDAAFLFRRGPDGSWTLVRKLFEERLGRYDDGDEDLTVAMEDGIAAVNPVGQMRIFERVNDDWVAATSEAHTRGDNLEIDGGTILGSESTCGWGAQSVRKNAAGTYVIRDTYIGVFDYCDDGQIAGDSDIWGTRVIVPQPSSSEDPSFVPFLYVWEGFPPGTPTSIPVIGPSSIEGDWITIAGTRADVLGTHFFRRQGLGNWVPQQTITMPDELLNPTPQVFQIGAVQMDDGFVLQGRTGNIDVFQRDAQDKYQYVAKLLGADRRPTLSGRTVVALGNDPLGGGAVMVYELPLALQQPDLRQDDFQDGNAADWMPQAGSNFTVVAAGGSYVYRQSSLAGNAISVLGNSDLENQAIQVDVTPTAFNGNDRWFGLIARYTDANNYYYVTVRQSNTVQIRRIVNGVFTSLASAPFPVSLNRTYSLRLEAVAQRLRVYVDNKLLLATLDRTHSHGQVGLMTYKTRADYDNVTLSTQNFLPLLTDDFGTSYPNRWHVEGGNWQEGSDTEPVYTQISLTDTARSVTGVATGDQMVQVDVTPTAFNGTGRWFGVIARYVDVGNYYYVTVRNNDVISLRRLINGAIHELDSAPLDVQTGATYRIRLDAIGNSLRVRVNGKHLLEATDSTFPTGRYGLATYKASAQFDEFIAAQP